METDRKPYICRYASAGVEYTCRIDAGSAEEAAAIMNALPWGVESGPIGMPRRLYPHLDGVINYAVSRLEQMRQRLASAGPHEAQSWTGVSRTANGRRG